MRNWGAEAAVLAGRGYPHLPVRAIKYNTAADVVVVLYDTGLVLVVRDGNYAQPQVVPAGWDVREVEVVRWARTGPGKQKGAPPAPCVAMAVAGRDANCVPFFQVGTTRWGLHAFGAARPRALTRAPSHRPNQDCLLYADADSLMKGPDCQRQTEQTVRLLPKGPAPSALAVAGTHVAVLTAVDIRVVRLQDAAMVAALSLAPCAEVCVATGARQRLRQRPLLLQAAPDAASQAWADCEGALVLYDGVGESRVTKRRRSPASESGLSSSAGESSEGISSSSDSVSSASDAEDFEDEWYFMEDCPSAAVPVTDEGMAEDGEQGHAADRDMGSENSGPESADESMAVEWAVEFACREAAKAGQERAHEGPHAPQQWGAEVDDDQAFAAAQPVWPQVPGWGFAGADQQQAPPSLHLHPQAHAPSSTQVQAPAQSHLRLHPPVPQHPYSVTHPHLPQQQPQLHPQYGHAQQSVYQAHMLSPNAASDAPCTDPAGAPNVSQHWAPIFYSPQPSAFQSPLHCASAHPHHSIFQSPQPTSFQLSQPSESPQHCTSQPLPASTSQPRQQCTFQPLPAMLQSQQQFPSQLPPPAISEPLQPSTWQSPESLRVQTTQRSIFQDPPPIQPPHRSIGQSRAPSIFQSPQTPAFQSAQPSPSHPPDSSTSQPPHRSIFQSPQSSAMHARPSITSLRRQYASHVASLASHVESTAPLTFWPTPLHRPIWPSRPKKQGSMRRPSAAAQETPSQDQRQHRNPQVTADPLPSPCTARHRPKRVKHSPPPPSHPQSPPCAALPTADVHASPTRDTPSRRAVIKSGTCGHFNRKTLARCPALVVRHRRYCAAHLCPAPACQREKHERWAMCFRCDPQFLQRLQQLSSEHPRPLTAPPQPFDLLLGQAQSRALPSEAPCSPTDSGFARQQLAAACAGAAVLAMWVCKAAKAQWRAAHRQVKLEGDVRARLAVLPQQLKWAAQRALQITVPPDSPLAFSSEAASDSDAVAALSLQVQHLLQPAPHMSGSGRCYAFLYPTAMLREYHLPHRNPSLQLLRIRTPLAHPCLGQLGLFTGDEALEAKVEVL